MKPRNSIYFDESLAQDYAYTRPFLLNGHDSRVLSRIAEATVAAAIQRKQQIVYFMEAGCGVGRISFPLAEAFEAAVQNAPADRRPRIELHCLDASRPMLQKLEDKLAQLKHSSVVVKPYLQDVRDLGLEGIKFDACLAHWIFHVILDWRVAVAAINGAMADHSSIYILNEESPYYDAIDDNLTLIDGVAHRFWSEYHRIRRDVCKHMSHELGVTSPRMRLGARVVDDRVITMFGALGWDVAGPLGKTDSWSVKRSIKDIIDSVIRKQSFTNMRLFRDSLSGRAAFTQIADQLIDRCRADDTLNEELTINISLKCSTLTRRGERQGELLALTRDLVANTLGRKSRLRLAPSYDPDQLWLRLFETVNAGFASFCGTDSRRGQGGQRRVAANIRWILSVTPYSQAVRGRSRLWSRRGVTVDAGAVADAWRLLLSGIDSEEPVMLAPDAICLKNPTNGWIHPSVHQVQLSKRMLTALRELGGPSDSKDTRFNNLHRVKAQYAGDLLALRTALTASGLVRSEMPRQFDQVLLGLADCLSLSGKGQFYIFPVPNSSDAEPSDGSVSGFLVATDEPLSFADVRAFFELASLLFDGYLEELSLRPLHTDEEGVDDALQLENDVLALVPSAKLIGKRGAAASARAALFLTVNDREDRAFWHVLKKSTLEPSLKIAPLSDIRGHRIDTDLGQILYCNVGKGGSARDGKLGISDVMQVCGDNVDLVIMTGCACGLQSEARALQIADVLIARAVRQKALRLTEFGSQDQSQVRDVEDRLSRAVDAFAKRWSSGNLLRGSRVIPGEVIASADYLDSDKHREELRMLYPDAIGLEMEGWALADACSAKKRPWLLIKGISDWGKGTNNYNQARAAANASLVGLSLWNELIVGGWR